jgi:hypothetical protein
LTDRNVRIAGSKKSGRVAVDKLQTSMFQDRTLSAPAFKRMLGEINDPANAYTTTVADLATFSATDDFLTYMAKQAGSEGDIITDAAQDVWMQLFEKAHTQSWKLTIGVL